MQLNPLPIKPKTILEEKAYQILHQLDIYTPEQINIEFITNSHHIEILYCNSKSRTIVHPYLSGWYQIIINNELSEQEQREKIAHELGHLFMHTGNQFIMPSDFIQLQEHQTELFVGYLLVPFFMINELPDYPDEAIYYLSNRFNVTSGLAKKKYQQLISRQYAYRYQYIG